MKYQTKYSANEFWNDILLHDHEHSSSIIPLAGPKFLWDARLTNTLTIENVNSVTSWLDYYNNVNLEQYFDHDSTKAPGYEVVSDSATLNFNGINNYLAVYPLNETSLNFTILVVATDLQDNLADNSGTILYAFNSDSGNFNISYIAGNQIGIAEDTNQLGVFVAQSKQVIAIRVSGDGTLAQAYVNGGAGGSSAISIAGGLQYLQIGSILGNNYLAGNVPWIAYYDTALSDSDLNTALSYAGTNFGITVTPVS